MKIKTVSNFLGVSTRKTTSPMEMYSNLRKKMFYQYFQNHIGTFQSPSVSPSPIIQQAAYQVKRVNETYLRYDFKPIDLEEKFNKFFRSINGAQSQSLFFNSGMSAITALILFLSSEVEPKRVSLGDYTFFETKHILRRIFETKIFDEGHIKLANNSYLVWLDYPTNDENNCFSDIPKLLDAIIKRSYLRYDCDFYLVIDYTVSALGFSLEKYLKELPVNLHIFLVSSLQKHMTYGLDLCTGGALTVYTRRSDIFSKLEMVRSYTGAFLNERSYFLLPDIDASLVKNIITDAGKHAEEIARAIINISQDIVVHYPFNSPENYLTSLIFIQIGDRLLQKSDKSVFVVDLLTKSILQEAEKAKVPIVHGTSFGFPMTRIFKNGDMHEDVRDLRIAAGYDDDLHGQVAIVIKKGIKRFLRLAEVL